MPKDILIDCVYSTVVSFNARGIAFNGRVLVGGSNQKHRFDICVFGGFGVVRNSAHVLGRCDIEFNDCAFICGAGSAFYGTSTKSSYKFTRCTIAANKANETSSARNIATYVDCVDKRSLRKSADKEEARRQAEEEEQKLLAKEERAAAERDFFYQYATIEEQWFA